MRYLRASLFLLCLVVTATLAACSGGERSSVSSTRASATENASAPSARVRPRAVRFTAADGVDVVGRLWGSGDVAVILAHGFSEYTAQDDWLPFDRALAQRGYAVLTFNFRGFCNDRVCSGTDNDLGNNWRDVLAAVAFMERRGAKKVLLIGASMGGLAVLRAARTPGVDLAGVVSLSTPQFPSKYYTVDVQANDLTPARLKQIDEPKLFIAGTRDVQRPEAGLMRPGIKSVRFAEDARRMYAAAEEPKQLALVDSLFHSSQLVTAVSIEPGIVKETRALIYRFLEANAGR